MRNKNGGNEIVRSLQMFKKIYKLPPSPLVLQHLHHQSPRRKTPQRTHHLPSVPFVLTFRKGAIPVTRKNYLQVWEIYLKIENQAGGGKEDEI